MVQGVDTEKWCILVGGQVGVQFRPQLVGRREQVKKTKPQWKRRDSGLVELGWKEVRDNREEEGKKENVPV